MKTCVSYEKDVLLKCDKIHGEVKSQKYKDIHYVGTLVLHGG
jgi:hypothetical protein